MENEQQDRKDTVPLSCLLPAKLSRRVMAYAKDTGLNRSSAVILLLQQGLENAGQTSITEHGA